MDIFTYKDVIVSFFKTHTLHESSIKKLLEERPEMAEDFYVFLKDNPAYGSVRGVVKANLAGLDISKHVCKVCGRQLTLEQVIRRNECCSKKCSNSDVEKIRRSEAKAASTNIKRYGCRYAVSSDVIRDKIRDTSMQRYGVDNPLKADVSKQRAKSSLLERYRRRLSNERQVNKG